MKALKEITAYDALVITRGVLSDLILNFLAAYGAICLVKNILLMIFQ